VVSESRRVRPIRLSRAAMIVVAVLALAGVGYLTITSGTEEVYVAAADLPAYRQLTQADVRVHTVNQRDVPDDAVRDRNALIGRYTLTAAEADRPFRTGSLGPRLPARAIQSAVVALPATPETSLGGRLARGDRVDVLLSREDEPAAEVRLADVLVLDIVNSAIVVATTPRDAATFATARGSSTIVVVRTTPYAGP
jgi:Flp pilus assembly protein CpaB